jgi:tetratricopeptide (TPR) repeat protein
MGAVDAQIAELSRTVDPAVLGSRLRAARVAAGLTQAEVAAGVASTAYISRIEAGQRRPELGLLGRLAERLHTSTEELVTGLTRNRSAELQLSLDYAELALASGNAADALAGVRTVMADLTGSTDQALRRSARHLLAAALEGAGDTDEAILLLEELVAEDPHDLTWLKSLTTLSRLYRDAGDFSRAIDVGERASVAIQQSGLEITGEAVQLSLTVAAAYYERGDANHAARVCQRTLRLATELGSPLALASAYWNASVIESRRGRAEIALPLAKKALHYFEAGEDARNLARLRSQVGIIQLRLDPPQPGEATATLRQAAQELELSSATPIDRADNDLALARAHHLLGDADEARRLADLGLGHAEGVAPLLVAEAHLIRGQIATGAGDLDDAREEYRTAIRVLSAAGADRRAGELWFELASLLDDLDAHDEAREAYRSAAATAGLSVRVSRRTVEGALAPGGTLQR